ncbi:MAG: alpha/beta hydrolase [Paracoccaceae bacterium]
MDAAPFLADIAEAPKGAVCAWLSAGDGVRIRAAHWRTGTKGTVLLFPGRSEYIEKYGPAAADFAKRGYAMAVLDWRGQGIADRLLDDPAPGHVGRFIDYQKDVAAFLDFARGEELPQPWFLVGHSMGGCIGLRAIHEGLPVRAVTFSAPMWGIRISTFLKPVARAMSSLAGLVRMDGRLAPSTSRTTYVLDTSFEDNLLTRDADMFAFMQRQARAHPELTIGGPSLRWLSEALHETRALTSLATPMLPCLTVLGEAERIVDIPAIHSLMARWQGATLELIPNAEHELMMEGAAIRARFYDSAAKLFDAHRG